MEIASGPGTIPGLADPHDPLSLPELEEAVRAVEPSAWLVPPRLLRHMVRVYASLGGFGFRVPHSKTYVIPSAALLEIANRNELGMRPTECLPPSVILLERPSTDDLEELSRSELLLHYWEWLFHARVHRELEHNSRLSLRESSDTFAERKATMDVTIIAQRVSQYRLRHVRRSSQCAARGAVPSATL